MAENIWRTRSRCSDSTCTVNLFFKKRCLLDFPGGVVDKNPPCNERDTCSIPGPERLDQLKPVRCNHWAPGLQPLSPWAATTEPLQLEPQLCIEDRGHGTRSGVSDSLAPQAPPSMGFSRQEHRSGLPCPSPGDLPNPGTEPGSPALQADSLPTKLLGKPISYKGLRIFQRIKIRQKSLCGAPILMEKDSERQTVT